MSLLPKILPRSNDQRRADFSRKMLRREAAIGGQLFKTKGQDHQFFCLDEHTWIWHISYKDKQGIKREITTRYEVRPNGVIKSQDGQPYQRLSLDEARNLYRAIELYQQRVDADYQKMLQTV